MQLEPHMTVEIHQALQELSALLRNADFPVIELRLDGSFRSGLALGLFNPQHRISDIDVVVIASPDIRIDECTCTQFAEIVNGVHTATRNPTRWGEPHTVAHVSALAGERIPYAGVWDFWLTTAPFITVSPSWQTLFSEEEVSWQRSVRKILALSNSNAEYSEFKALCLAEARWRMIACYAARSVPGLADREKLLMQDAPLNEAIPDCLRRFALRWACGDISDSWLARPITMLSFDVARIVENHESCRHFPETPPWVLYFNELQNRQIAKRYGLISHRVLEKTHADC